MFDTHKNFAIGTVLTAPADASGQDFVLMPGDEEVFANNMPVTLCPPNVEPTADNSEISYLMNVDGDAMTITRAQEGSLPMSVGTGWKVIGTVTAKTLADMEDAVANKPDIADLDEAVGLPRLLLTRGLRPL
jgi:hypothetical protein